MTYRPKFYPTVVHMLNQAAIEFGGEPAVIFEDRQLSYTQYARCIAGLARQLQGFTRGKSLRGERVSLICGNSIEMAVGLFAVHASGAQVVPINPIIIKILPSGNLGTNKPLNKSVISGLVIIAVIMNDKLIIITKKIRDLSRIL